MREGQAGSEKSFGKTKKRAFAILHTWPDMKNAEYEVVKRIAAAGTNIGAEVFIIDNDGYPLWASDRVLSRASPRIAAGDCDFMISLHFESPKLVDIPSYAALWNPPEFYHVFGYDPSVEKLASHDDLLSCSSAVADAHALNLFEGYGKGVPVPLPTLYHSLPGPFLEPNITHESRLFYVGINWERITGQKGRHQDLLERLDKANLIDIYGPEEFHGVEPWEGFVNYRGSIPFDGRSILSDINRAGVCLAFSSEAHQKCGIMSNRLFEGLAAGAAIIANPHPFIDRYFADCVYVVDDTRGSQQLARDVLAILSEIRRDPAEALRRARLGQERFKESFALERSLQQLFQVHEDRRAAVYDRFDLGIDVLVTYDGADVTTLIDMIREVAGQRGVRTHIVLICDRRLFESYASAIAEAAQGAHSFKTVLNDLFAPAQDIKSTLRRLNPQGRAVAEALGGLNSELFCLRGPGEHWFSDHLMKLATALARAPEALVAVSGSLVDVLDGEGKKRRKFNGLVFTEHWKLLHAVDLHAPGRFMFKASLARTMPVHLVACLDGLEHRALALWGYLKGPLAQSGAATHVSEQHAAAKVDGFINEALQIGMILDSVRSNARYASLLPHLRIPPVAPASFVTDSSRAAVRIKANVPYLTRTGGDGCVLLGEGFSRTEDDKTWIDGKTATMTFALPEFLNVAQGVLVLTLGGRKARKTGKDQVCTIRINRRIALDKVTITEREQQIELPLGDHAFLEDGDKITLGFQLQHADSVYDKAGRLTDPRKLGLWIGSLELEMTGAAGSSASVIELDRSYEFTLDGDGADLMGFGFSDSEKQWTWIDGKMARIIFMLPPDEDPARQTVLLTVGGRKAQKTGKDQVCSIKVNGQTILDRVTVQEIEQRLALRLADCSALKPGDRVTIELKLQHADPVFDDAGKVVDPRQLGLWIRSVETRLASPLVQNGPGKPVLNG